MHHFNVRLVALVLAAVAAQAQWQMEDSGTHASLRGIHNAAPCAAWASGANGIVLRSEDFGYLWQQCAIPAGADKLDFRGIWAWDANHAIVMSSGPGAASRLYETADGCAHWQLLFTNPDLDGFWDAMAFRNEREGILLGDPVDGRFVIFRTTDGGRHWSRDESGELKAQAKEGAFAASNSALTIGPDGSTYFATGGISGARIFYLDGSKSSKWRSSKLTFKHTSESAGIFSIAFRDGRHGVAAGGDYKNPNQREDTAAWTSDGGLTWNAAAEPPGGYRSAVAWDEKLQAWISVGLNGCDTSYDDGKSWKQFDHSAWNALSLPWAAGPDGKIATLNEAMPR